jgi:hypothetical protein
MIFFAVEIFYLTQTVRPVKSLEARFKRTQTVHSTVYVVTISEGIVSVKKMSDHVSDLRGDSASSCQIIASEMM